MIILLGISTAIAIVVPEPRQPDSQEETADSGTSGATGATGGTGEAGATGSGGPDQPGGSTGSEGPGSGTLIEATVKSDSKPDVVRAAPGDRLVLTVETVETAVVEITDLGLTQTTSRYAPAVFDLIVPGEPEVIKVTTTDGKKPLATIRSGA